MSFLYSNQSVRKHGTGFAGFPRFRCLDCKKSFQLDYAYEARKLGVKEKIVEMAMNSFAVRETGRVLNDSYNTVLSTLKTLAKASNKHPVR